MTARKAFSMFIAVGFILLVVGIAPRVIHAFGLLLPASADALALEGAPAQEGGTIPYPGRLADEAGQLVSDGIYGFVFALYEAESGGEPLWMETQEDVVVQGGAFTALLGSEVAIPASVLSGEARWLEVAVRGPGEVEFTALAPRQELSAVGETTAPNALSCEHTHVGEVWTANIAWSNGAIKVLNYGNGPTIWGWNGGGGNGLRGYATGAGVGVYGESVDSTGVLGRSTSGRGVEGYSTSGYGVYGESNSTDAGHFVSPTNDGVYASADGGSMWGVWGTSNDSHGMYANTDVSGGYGLYTPNKIYTGGGCVGCTSMLIAQNGGDETLELGDVVAVTGIAKAPSESYARPVLLVHKVDAASRQAVVGVVEGRYVSKSVTKDGMVVEDAHTTTEPVGPGEYMTIVYRGLAQVKADASFGIIQVGDLLAPSGSSGHAMLASTRVEGESALSVNAGPIVGKAMESLEQEQGLIWVLVDLQ